MADINERVIEWFASGDTGTSSKCIAFWLSVRTVSGTWGADTPSDPSDLGRCLRLLDKFPEFRARLSEMVEVGGHWPTFVERWDNIEQTFIRECGGKLLKRNEGRGIKCPQTYHLMKLAEADSYEARGYDVTRREDGTLSSVFKREAA